MGIKLSSNFLKRRKELCVGGLIQLMACRFCKTTNVSGKPSLCDLDKLEVPIALFLSPSGLQNRPQVKMEQEEEHLCILKTNKFLKQSC